MKKSAVIIGITGQDGSYLAEHLLGLGYEVHGILRHTSTTNTSNIQHILDRLTIWRGDVLDQSSIARVLKEAKPDEVYNLAAMSFVPTSWTQPAQTVHVTALGVLNVLEAIKGTGFGAKFYQASSSEMFGDVAEEPQTEQTPFRPRSPYGVSKVFGHQITVNYRESYRDCYACSGILFNHESPRRGLEFVTRKITRAVARIKLGQQETLELGNLDACRDWGCAADYVQAMHLMLQETRPSDYVVATGVSHTVRCFAQAAFECVDLDFRKYVKVNDALCRPAEVNTLRGDSTKMHKTTGWKPEVSFLGLVRSMVDNDLLLCQQHC